MRVEDCEARPVLLAPDDWSVRYMTEKNPEVVLHRMPVTT